MLSSYSDNWLFHMGAGSACIVSSKSEATNKTNPVGTGPFKFGTWNRGASLSLTRNDAYWGTKASLTDIEFRFISDAQAMNNALKAGDVDAIGQVRGPEQLADFQQDPNFMVISGAPAGKVMVSINETSGPLADVRVRQALYAAIDRKAWIDGIAAGYAVPIGSHATPNDGEPYYADMTSINTYDPNKARQLLSDAGQSKSEPAPGADQQPSPTRFAAPTSWPASFRRLASRSRSSRWSFRAGCSRCSADRRTTI